MALTKIRTGGITADAVDNTILKLDDDFALTGTVSGAGKILQVVTTNSTDGNTGNITTLTAAGTVAITPSATSSKIFVIAHGAGQVTCGSNGIMETQILRGGTDGTKLGVFYSGMSTTTNNQIHYFAPHNSATDSPSSTSEITYTWAVTKGSGGTTNARIFASASFPLTMTAMEIGG